MSTRVTPGTTVLAPIPPALPRNSLRHAQTAVIAGLEDGIVIAAIHVVMLVQLPLKLDDEAVETEISIGGLHMKMSHGLARDGVHMGQGRDRLGGD